MKSWVRIGMGSAAALIAAAFLLHGDGADEVKRQQLAHHRNLGKAFYENPTTQLMAVGEFEKALKLAPDSARERVNYGLALLRAGKTPEGVAELEKAQKQDPSIPHTWFNLGIAYKKDSEYDKAIPQLEKMIQLVPDEAISHYNLGVLYKLTGKAEQSIKMFEMATKLNPILAGPHFQLANAYRTSGKAEDAKREQAIFLELKAKKAGQEDLEWSYYAEILDPTDPAMAKDASTPVEVKLTAKRLGAGLDAATAGLDSADFDGDGKPEIVAWSSKGLSIFKDGATSGTEIVKGAVVSAAAADFNNDGLADLAVVTAEGAALYVNKKGSFEKAAAALPAGSFSKALWLDYDHDYDIDLLLFGPKPALARNNGTAGFSDQTAEFPFVAGKATDAVVFDTIPDTDGMDVAVVYADRAATLYVDKMMGKYVAQELVLIPAGAKQILAADTNNDSATDLTAWTGSGSVALINDGKGRFKTMQGPPTASPLALIDFENRGLVDLAAGAQAFRNNGMLQGAPAKVQGLAAGAATLAGDFDADGRTDLAIVTADGAVDLLRNETVAPGGFLRIALTGVKNPKIPYQSEVEVKAGTLYSKQMFRGVPMVFGLRGNKEIETVRITWPNGMIQNELKQVPGKTAAFKEAPRLSGSCPMIFTWNGSEWEFLTDVLGTAPLGASAGDGTFFPLDHDEYVQVPAQRMVPINGAYEVRVTEELREVSYLDQIKLVAVDHPARTEIFTNDKFKAPPFAEFRLFGVERRIAPRAARDHRGVDVLGSVLRRDRTYADTFKRDYSGAAELHSLTLDFAGAAKNNKAVLILSGWVDWADGSTFRAASQEKPGGLVMPYLQVKDAQGQWRTVIEDMGIPAGKPKTIAVDLTGKFLSASREVRIVTSVCVYWDEAFLSETPETPAHRLTPLVAGDAGLRFRGFSKPVIHPERKQPEYFVYSDVQPATSWNPTPGLYTKYGDVTPLLEGIDDRYVIMGAGDELTLRFDAKALPPLPQGWTREFLLFFDGWAKDADANTAYSKNVEPLPFHGMSGYPYGASEKFPQGEMHKAWREHYNTRPALRVLRPLRGTTERVNPSE